MAEARPPYRFDTRGQAGAGCQGTTARGRPCAVPPRAGRRCCVWHDDDAGLAEVRRAGRLRGNAIANENRRLRGISTVIRAHEAGNASPEGVGPAELPPWWGRLSDANLAAQAIREASQAVFSGLLDPRRADSFIAGVSKSFDVERSAGIGQAPSKRILLEFSELGAAPVTDTGGAPPPELPAPAAEGPADAEADDDDNEADPASERP